jgi:CPA1 family monovalent cation:H+ antiporter
VEVTVSLLTPFVSYLIAERAHVSGVLAVVTTGLFVGWRVPEITSSKTRLQGGPVWDMVEFILNGCVFILIGLQLPDAVSALSGSSFSVGRLVWYAVVTSVAVILVRLLWVYPAAYLPRLLFKRICERDPIPSWRSLLIVGWTGMRGVVSLAAAMALPLTTQAGNPFPGRDLIIFLTFTVIMATLVLQGLSLPFLIRWLEIKPDSSAEYEEREARLKANQAALARLWDLRESNPSKEEALDRLRVEYEDRIRQLNAYEPQESGPRHLFSSEYEQLSHEALEVERRTIIELRNELRISDDVLRRIQRDIDLAEVRLE